MNATARARTHTHAHAPARVRVQLMAVDGQQTQGLDIIAALRGTNVPGSSVKLTVRRAHGEVFEVSKVCVSTRGDLRS